MLPTRFMSTIMSLLLLFNLCFTHFVGQLDEWFSHILSTVPSAQSVESDAPTHSVDFDFNSLLYNLRPNVFALCGSLGSYTPSSTRFSFLSSGSGVGVFLLFDLPSERMRFGLTSNLRLRIRAPLAPVASAPLSGDSDSATASSFGGLFDAALVDPVADFAGVDADITMVGIWASDC